MTLSRPKPRLLYVGNDVRYFVTHRLTLAEAARDAGFRITAALPADSDPADLRRVASAGMSLVAYPFVRGGMRPHRELKTLVALYRLYRQLQPDLVHQLTVKPVLYGGLAARLAGVPAVVQTIPGLGYLFVDSSKKAVWLRRLLAPLFRIALGGSKRRIILQNGDDLKTLLRLRMLPHAGRDVVVIRGSGVDVTEFAFSPLPEGPPIVLLASRLTWHKGVAEFVEAARRIKAEGITARFVLCGSPDTENPGGVPQTLLDQWQAEGIVECWGYRADMPEVFRQATIVVSPSKYGEGVPKSLIEAAAAGRPIVTSDAPGCREIVRDGENGYLAPISDAAAVADGISRLLKAPRAAAQMGRRGREIVEAEFALPHVLNKTLALYRQVMPVGEMAPSSRAET